MTVAAHTLRAVRPALRTDPELRTHEAPLLVAGAVVDAVATAILLAGTPLPRPLEGLAAGVAHGAAVLLFFGSSRGQPGRRWLSVAAVAAVPLVGAAVAAASLVTRGRGSVALGRHRRARPRGVRTGVVMQRLESALSPCDALEWGDEDERRVALSALSCREDPEAIALLRRAAAGEDPDLALSAALVLDEIGARAERRTGRLVHAELRRDAG